MKIKRLGSTLSVSARLLTLTLCLTGCPFGDCFGTADIAVSVDKSLAVPPGAQIWVAQVMRILSTDVTGTSPDGLPLGPAAMNPRIIEVTFDPATATGHAYDGLTDPDPTWYYAFVDLNNNFRLDAGEPFGTDPHNPSSPPDGFSCKRIDYRGAITIDRKLP